MASQLISAQKIMFKYVQGFARFLATDKDVFSVI